MNARPDERSQLSAKLQIAKARIEELEAALLNERRAECSACGEIAARWGGNAADNIAEIILARNFGRTGT